MKPQALRKTLWIASGLLAAGVAGVVGWYALKVRPARAAPSKEVASWLDRAVKAYHAEPIRPQVVHPVDEKELLAITRPDLPRIGGKKVGAFVGPVPPDPQPEAEKPTVAAGPKGLAEVGRPVMVMVVPPRPATFLWEHANDPKRRDVFRVGDVVPKDGRFKVVEVTPVEDPATGSRRFKFVYEYEESPGKTKRDEVVFDTKPTDAEPTSIKTVPAPAAAGSEGTGGVDAVRPVSRAPEAGPDAAAGTDVAPVAAVPVPEERPSAVKLHRERVGAATRFSFETRASYERYARDLESNLSQVKTEDALDADGRPRGVRITGGVGPGTLAEEFEIRPGDILVSINKRPVHSRNDVASILRSLKDVATIEVVIERNARQLFYQVDPRDPDTRRNADKLKFQ
jgi:hypothetical protein